MRKFNMKISFTIFALLLNFQNYVIADPFVGNFSGNEEGDHYQLIINKNQNGSYEGFILEDGNKIAIVGNKQDNKLIGVIEELGERYEFIITSQNNGTLLLVDEDGESLLFQKTTVVETNANNNEKNSNMDQQNLSRQIFINRIQLNPKAMHAIEANNQTPIAEGRYWYDVNCGAWGVEGGPTAGFIQAGLSLPGPMPTDISGGGTGIFINGREIHPLDQQALNALFGVTYQGQFWMDAQGSIGYLGGPAIANILQTAQAKQSNNNSEGGSVTHGYDSTYGARGTSSGGMYSGRTATGKSVFWYPGM